MQDHFPHEAAIRELGMEWRDRPISDSQVIFCERYGLPYSTEWSRGMANNMIDKFVVEVGVDWWSCVVERGGEGGSGHTRWPTT